MYNITLFSYIDFTRRILLSKDCSTGNKENYILFIIPFGLGIPKTSKQHILVNLL